MRLGNIINWAYIFLCILGWAVDTITGTRMLSRLHIDVIVLLMAFAINGRDVYFRKAFVSGPIMIWGLWTVYSIVNWFICPYSVRTADAHAHWYWEIFSLSRTYFMLTILYFEACLDFPRTLKLITSAFIIYFIIGIGGQWGGPMRDDEVWEGRNGTILGNHFPLNMICSLFAVALANIYGYFTRKQLFLWTCFVVFVILWVATRKALGGLFLLVLFYIIANLKNLSFSNILKLSFAVGALYFIFNTALDYTLVGQRMNAIRIYDTQIEVPVWLSFLGDRAIQYILAWEVFLQHPLYGVGIGNSMDYTGLPIPIHSEYMEQLCEGGIVGTALYVWFNISIFKNIFYSYIERSKKVTIICMGGMVILLFLSITAWLYNMPCFFVIYTLVIAYCYPQTDEMPDEYNEDDWENEEEDVYA